MIIASHIMSFCLDYVWTHRFPPGRKPAIKLATFEVVNDLKKSSSPRKTMLQNVFHVYADTEVKDLKKSKVWDFAMALTKTNKKHFFVVILKYF